MKRVFFASLLLLALTVSLCSCYCIDSRSADDYAEFYGETHDRGAPFDLLPPPDTASVDGAILFYDESELVDTLYTVYLVCRFDGDAYAAERARLDALGERYGELAEVNSSEFSLDSLSLDRWLVTQDDGFVSISLCHALFPDDGESIVYVIDFEEGYGAGSRLADVPREHLPTDVVELLEQAHSEGDASER